MSSNKAPDRSLTAEQKSVWTEGLDALMAAAHHENRTALVIDLVGPERATSFKSDLSRFFNGDPQTLGLWLDRNPARYAEPLAKALKVSVDNLRALFDRAREDEGRAPEEPWHPSFPKVSRTDALIPVALEVADGLGAIVLQGVRGDGLDVAVEQLRARHSMGAQAVDVSICELYEGARAPRHEGRRVVRAEPWGAAKLCKLIDRLVGWRVDEHGTRAKGPPLVAQEAAQRLARLAGQLRAQPSLLPVRRVRELIEWLGRVARGEAPGNPHTWTELKVHAERTRWREGAAGDALTWLSDLEIEAVMRTGWAAEARTRRAWEQAVEMALVAEPRLSPERRSALRGQITRNRMRREDLEALVKVLMHLDEPSSLVSTLIEGGILAGPPTGPLMLANLAAAQGVIGAWVARSPDGAGWWVKHADRPGALDVLRAAAAAGLQWTGLRAALDRAERLDPVDACRAVIAFAGSSSRASEVVVDEQFVGAWAGAMWAAMHAVYEASPMSSGREEHLTRSDSSPTLLPCETDLVALPDSVRHQLPFFMPEGFRDAFLAYVGFEVENVTASWFARVNHFRLVDVELDSDALYALFRVFAPWCAWPRSYLSQEETRWEWVEKRAERDDALRLKLASWPIDQPTEVTPLPIRGLFDLPVRVRETPPEPPLPVLLRWASRGNDLGGAALNRWAGLYLRCVPWGEPGEADEARFEAVVAALRCFDRTVLEDAITLAYADAGPLRSVVGRLGGRTFRSCSNAAIRLAKALRSTRVLATVSKEARAPFNTTINAGRLESSTGLATVPANLEATLDAIVAEGIDAATHLADLGDDSELMAWSEWNLREATPVEWLNAYATLSAWRGIPYARALPSPEVCEEQVSAWLDGESGDRASQWRAFYLRWLPPIEAARKLKSAALLLNQVHLHQEWANDGHERRTGADAMKDLTRYGAYLNPLKHGPLFDAKQHWAVAVVQTVVAVAGRHNGLVFTESMKAWAAGLGVASAEEWIRGVEWRARSQAEAALSSLQSLVPEAPPIVTSLGPRTAPVQPARTAAETRRDLYHGLIWRQEPDTDESRAQCQRFADEARMAPPPAMASAEVLYWTLRGGLVLEGAVRACLDAPDFSSWPDDFEVTVEPDASSVRGGRMVALALASEHATAAQALSLVLGFPLGWRDEAFDSNWRTIKLPSALGVLGGRIEESLRALAHRKLSHQQLLALPHDRLRALGLMAWYLNHIPLQQARSHLLAFLDLPISRQEDAWYRTVGDIELLVRRLADSDEAFASIASNALIVRSPEHLGSGALMDELVVRDPECAVEVYRAWLDRERGEDAHQLLTWLAQDAAWLPGGNRLLRAAFQS